MKIMNLKHLSITCIISLICASTAAQSYPLTSKWQHLFDGDHTTNWDVYMGVPHKTVKGLDNVDPNSDGKKGIPLGLNNDPKKVFKFKTIDGEKVLHISGEIYGSLTSKNKYKNYHLQLKFKWGEKVWEPRLTRERDNGILYHGTGEHGKFWDVWMRSQEFQVQEGDMGDYYGLAGTIYDIPASKKEGEKEFDYNKSAALVQFPDKPNKIPPHCNKGFDNENPHGEWNTLDLICYGDTSLHIVNGKVVMALYNSKVKNDEGEIISLQSGFIQIQSEAAEAFYKDVKIKSIKSIPKIYRKQL